MRLSFITILLLLLGNACKPDTQLAEQRAKWDAIMAVHDEVMPEMATIDRLRKALREQLAKLDSTSQVFQYSEIQAAIFGLEQADEGMMTWMAELPPFDQLRQRETHNGMLAFLDGEQKKIDAVKTNMLNSIARAKELLERYNALPAENGQNPIK